MATAFVGSLAAFYATPTRSAVQLRPGVEAWRDDLRGAVAGKVAAQLHWDEGAPGRAHDLGEAGWMALRLFAFYAEQSDLELPDRVPALLELDREFRAAHDGKFERSRYGQLLACRVWLPGDFPVTFKVPLPDGDAAEVGSLEVLADQLQWLNGRTFQADEAEIARWQTLPAPAGGALLDAARRGFAGLSAAVAWGRAERLPVLVREA